MHINTHRAYRGFCSPGPGENSFQVVLEQSDLYITSAQDLSAPALDRLQLVRGRILAYSQFNPDFLTSLSPLPVDNQAPDIVQEMARAGGLFQVGPMAAVAGAIAQDIADFLAVRSPEIIIENGGDIYLYSKRTRTIGLLPHPDRSMSLGLVIPETGFPCAVCSSSATVGHSLSLGHGDLVTVKAKNGAVADAAATALCNLIRDRKSLSGLRKTADKFLGTHISGVLAQMGEDMMVVGDMELAAI
ncbi:UPF0280 family protein [Desulfonatronospira sp. MSAO_Bac3]|uniref:UPF0280 family protein n=1 Tax=Desulfonatronospira sp. MSAO_Bac3 TaxID=2293857 RepID=UPI000FF0FB80|nr:UPF0280 family protein [Desulfonatronospira sp. MSAO_Bac3]RQD79579.1 MAG: UPF0280 family protein [Desulfonatronospira sp. MSAO_Bac3]